MFRALRRLFSSLKLVAIVAGGLVIVLGGVSMVAGLACCLGLVAADRGTASSVQATVASHHWKRSVQIEELFWDDKEDWCSNMPDDAVLLDEWTERKRGVRRRGPKKARCAFQVRTWRAVDTPSLDGDGFEPAWPTVQVDGCEDVGCRREGERVERLEVVLAVPERDEPLRCALPEAAWRALGDGQAVTVSVGGMSGQPLCDTLTPVEIGA